MATDYSQYLNPQSRQVGDIVDGRRFTEDDFARANAARSGMIQQAMAQGALNADQIDQLLRQGDINQSQVGGDYWKSVAERNKEELVRQQQQIEIDKKRGYDSNGRPVRQDFDGIANEDGSLKDPYKMSSWQDVNANTDALNKYSQTALRDPKQQSAWAQLMNEQIGAQTAQNMDNAATMGANNLLAAESQLAQSGGISGAQRERLAMKNMRDQLLNKQQINRQGALDRMNVATQDESQRMQQLGALQTMQNQQADMSAKNQQFAKETEKFNIGNAINNQNAKNLYGMEGYKSALAEWGANQTADAQARAARSSGGKK
jgi:hypothetical protein